MEISMIKRAQRKLGAFYTTDSFLAGVARIASGAVIAQVANVLAAPLLSRLYCPYDFSNYALFLAAFAVGSAITTLKYDTAVVSAPSNAEAGRLVIASALLSTIMATLSCMILVLFVKFQLLGFGGLPLSAVLLLHPMLVTHACFVTLRQWYIRQSQFGQLSWEILWHGLCRAATQIGFGATFLAVFGLPLGEMVARLFASGRMICSSIPSLRHALTGTKINDVMHVMRNNSQCARHAVPSTLIDAISASLPIPLFVQCFGATAGASLFLIQRVFSIPAAMIGFSVADVFHKKLAEIHQGDTKGAVRLLDNTVSYLLILGSIPCVILFLTGRWAVPCLFGPEWVEAGEIGSIIAPMTLIQFAISPVSQCFSVYRAYRFKILFDLFYLALTASTICGCHIATFSFQTTILCYSIAGTASMCLYYLLMRHVANLLHSSRILTPEGGILAKHAA